MSTLLFFLAVAVAWFFPGMIIGSMLAEKYGSKPMVIWALVEVVLIAVVLAL